jgi:hypothetical protein
LEKVCFFGALLIVSGAVIHLDSLVLLPFHWNFVGSCPSV